MGFSEDRVLGWCLWCGVVAGGHGGVGIAHAGGEEAGLGWLLVPYGEAYALPSM